jgi:RNA polymerase sigma-70 factor, ECF subfamily
MKNEHEANGERLIQLPTGEPLPTSNSRGGTATTTRRTAKQSGVAQQSSIEELRVLYDLHGAEIFRFCNRLLGDVGNAEEAVQETFLRAWRSGDSWDSAIATKRTWMYAIARNACIDLLRARQRRVPLDSAGYGEGDSERSLLKEIGTDDPAFESVMSGWLLEEALRRIGPDHRDAIVSTYVHDRSYPEVAAELGIPEATLRTRVFYGLRALRKVLEEMGWHE